MKRGLLVLTVCGAIAFGLVAPAPARAAGVDPSQATAVQREQAQSKYVRGKKKYDDGDYKGAYEEFSGSLEIVASPNARLYAARALERMGRLVEAYAEYGRTAIEAKEHEHEDGRYAKAGEAAAAERNLLAPKLGFLELTISHANDQTKLLVAGDEIRRAGWSEPIPVMPGSVEIEIDSPNVAPVKTQARVDTGKHVQLSLDAGADAAAAPVVVAPPPSPEEKSSENKWLFPVGLGAAGVGVAGVITFAVAGAMSSSTYSDLQKTCGSAPCPASKQDEVSQGKTQQTVANVGLVIGIVGALGGGGLLVWYFTHKSAAASAPTTALAVGPAWLGVRGTF